MASWKKIIVSGSSAELAALQVDNLTSGQVVIGGGSAGNLSTTAINGTGDILATTGATGVSISGSFSGSFQGDGSQLTGVVASTAFSLTQGEGVSAFTYNGTSAQTVAISGAAQLSDDAIVKWDDTDGKFVNSSLTDNGTTLTGTASIQLSGASSSLTGSFTGSFVGDGSGLTGLATTLSGSTDSGDFEVDLLTQTLTIQGTAGEIETSATGTTITVGLPTDVDIDGDLTVGGDLTVNGDVTYLNVTNLYVEDRFILLNSGSTSGDGGIIIQSGSADQGKAFFYDESENRWAYADGISGSATGATPEAFAAMVVQNDGEGPVTYQKNGNIRVTNTGDIFIYS
jgi:hypothetical protein